jgi:hypothetical protein
MRDHFDNQKKIFVPTRPKNTNVKYEMSCHTECTCEIIDHSKVMAKVEVSVGDQNLPDTTSLITRAKSNKSNSN